MSKTKLDEVVSAEPLMSDPSVTQSDVRLRRLPSTKEGLSIYLAFFLCLVNTPDGE